MARREFVDILREVRHGEMLEELGEKLNDLVQAVDGAGKNGELIIKLTLKPTKSGAIEMMDDVKVKLPSLTKGSSLFFPTVEGNLQRNDPRQKEIPGLKEVSHERKPVKDAKNG